MSGSSGLPGGSSYCLARVVDVGTPPSGFEDWTTTMVRFHNFADLPTTKDEGIDSPKFTCFRHIGQ